MQRAAVRAAAAVLWPPSSAAPARAMSFSVNPGVSMGTLAALTDLRAPHSWYGAARQVKRRIIAHLGPTNSGKTHAALQALCAADSGTYAGPLRLLAWEQADRLNSREGVPCSLVTGQEREPVPGARHSACTMEMVDLSAPVGVGVLDEIQLLGDEQRGWAWTRAFLGLPATHLHVCGDAAAEPLLRALAAATGEELEVRRYERLSPLTLERRTVTDWRSVRAGDAVVAFSRKALFDIKASVEAATSLRCAVVYGALPPAVRRQQAAGFNDPASGLDVLVATDAIGMGLNLAIRRVLFSATAKFDGHATRPLTVSEAKQIAGRAGRFGSAHPEGWVAVRSTADAALLSHALATPSPELKAAGLAPSSEQLELFAASIATPQQRQRLLVERADRELGVAWRAALPAAWSGEGDSDDSLHATASAAAALLARLAALLEQQVSAAGAAPSLGEQYAQRLAVLQRGVEALAPADAGAPFQSLFAGLHGRAPSWGDALAAGELQELATPPRRGAAAAGDYAAEWADSDDEEEEEGEVLAAPTAEQVAMRAASAALTAQLKGAPPVPVGGAGHADFGAAVPAPRDIPFSALLSLFLDFAKVDEEAFFLCDHGDTLRVAAAIDDVPLPLAARFAFCRAPVDVDNPVALKALRRYAARYAAGKPVPVALRVPEREPQNSWELKALEGAHGVFDTYLWLAQRFPGAFPSSRRAQRAVERIEGMMNTALETMGAEARQPRNRRGGSPRRAGAQEAAAAALASAPRSGDAASLMAHTRKLRSALDGPPLPPALVGKLRTALKRTQRQLRAVVR